MTRLLAALLLCLGLAAADMPEGQEAEFLAAARAANAAYQRHLAALNDQLAEPDERLTAIASLKRLHDPQAIPTLLPFLDADNYDVATVTAAITALVELDAIEAVTKLRDLSDREQEAETERDAIRLAALNALHQLDQLQKHDYRREAETSNDQTRALGVTDLGTIKDDEAGPILSRALNDPRRHIRRMAAIGLGKLGDRSWAKDLVDRLTDPDPLVRRYAAEALVRLDYKEAIPYLLIALDANVASGNLDWALRQLADHDFGFDPFANRIDRQAAIDEGFIWWDSNKEALLE